MDLIRILFLTANPLDENYLQLDKEFNHIDDMLQSTNYRNRFDLVGRTAVSKVDLQKFLLRYKPAIVHFSGHGSKRGSLVFQSESGLAEEATQDAITNLFKIVGKNIDCVILNACYSEIQGKEIAKHVRYVIGISKDISDDAAIIFSTAFYQALGQGEEIPNAFELGRNQIELSNIFPNIKQPKRRTNKIRTQIEMIKMITPETYKNGI